MTNSQKQIIGTFKGLYERGLRSQALIALQKMNNKLPKNEQMTVAEVIDEINKNIPDSFLKLV